MTPFLSVSTRHCAISCGTPALCHAIRIGFLDTESKALCMSHVLICRGGPYSIASSSRSICCSIAAYVPLCALYPCWETLGMSCLRQTAWSFRRTHLLHILRSASTRMIGLRSPTALISAVHFFASAFSQRHFHSGIYCFLFQHVNMPS